MDFMRACMKNSHFLRDCLTIGKVMNEGFLEVLCEVFKNVDRTNINIDII
jgi:hypothetical protein